MPPANRRQRLRERTHEALGRYATLQVEVEACQEELPLPGDLFLLAATRELPVEWLVIDRDLTSDRVLVAPADTNPLVGSHDVRVPEAAAAGPLSLRCRFATWLPARALNQQKRTGLIAADYVHKALYKWQEIQDGALTGSCLEQEVDTDPEYEDWLDDVVAKAMVATSTAGSQQVEARGKPGSLFLFRSRKTIANLYPVAASILLLSTLGLAAALVMERRTARFTRNILVVHPNPAVERSGDSPDVEFVFSPAVPGVLLRLEVEVGFPSYHAEVLKEGSRERVKLFDALTQLPNGEVTILFSRDSFPDGDYRILVHALGPLGPLGEGESKQIESLRLRIGALPRDGF